LQVNFCKKRQKAWLNLAFVHKCRLRKGGVSDIILRQLNNHQDDQIMSQSDADRVNAYTIDGDLFKVLINDEEQYSIWPAKKDIPAGWYDKGFTGSKAEVSQYIDEHWKDMRPASLRKAMQAAEK
jgi:MbtH protein